MGSGPIAGGGDGSPDAISELSGPKTQLRKRRSHLFVARSDSKKPAILVRSVAPERSESAVFGGYGALRITGRGDGSPEQ